MGYTPALLFLFVFRDPLSLKPNSFYTYPGIDVRELIVLCALLSICVFLLHSFEGLASNTPLTRFFELILLLYVPVTSYR